MKKRVLHVINSLAPGGAETLLANSLSEGGLQEYADNIVVYFQGTSSLEQKIDKSIKIYNLRYKGLFSLPQTLIKLRRVIKKEKIDIVHSHLNPAGFYTHLICPVTQVHTLHTAYSFDKENHPFKLFLERILFFKKKACNIILLSDFIKQDFLHSIPFKGKSFVLNNFVEDSFFKERSKKNRLSKAGLSLVAVGRLSEAKNFQYLLEVFSYLKEYEIYLDIYGGGEIEKYEERIKGSGIKVTMKGHNSNLSEVLGRYDLFIMPSKFEGFPLSVFEAMAAGIPVALSAIAPLKSIVNDNALYFELNDPKGTADLILKVFKKEIDTDAMAKKAKIYADNVARRDRYIKRLMDIYQQLLS